MAQLKKGAFTRWLAKPEYRQYRQNFLRDGFLRLPRFFDGTVCDRITQEASAFYGRRGVAAEKADRTMNFHQESPAAQNVLKDPRLMEILGVLLSAPPVFFQSIYFNRGSEQNAHSDYIYLSTNPDFHLCGVWTACEDIAEEAGPLIYYPGSHRLPMQNVKDRYRERIDAVRQEMHAKEAELLDRYKSRRGITKESLLTCYFYDQWLDEIYAALKAGKFKKQTFMVNKGDVMIWHANLVHGGSPVKNKDRTRKSLVAHYLTEAVVEYFDMTYVDAQTTLSPKNLDRDRPAVLQVKP
ncbi:MAG TPA: phytanoyl-CoA dioxygenase family protein [Gemmataceae bacterium]|nr:phytanoyl-CoA dioxygenase family protein [Gemmataceae bacterium]